MPVPSVVSLLRLEVKRKGSVMQKSIPIVFGVAGGTASGKTTVARAVLDSVGASQFAYLPHDAYYKNRDDLSAEERALLNYDHPNS